MMTFSEYSFSDWINRTSMTSLKQFVGIGLWVIASLAMTYACFDLLLTDPGDYVENMPLALGTDEATALSRLTLYTAQADFYVKQAHSTGMLLAGALLTALVGNKVVETIQHGKDRDTSKDKILAEGQAQATVERAKIEAVGNGHTTKERLAIEAKQANVNVEVSDGVVRRGE